MAKSALRIYPSNSAGLVMAERRNRGELVLAMGASRFWPARRG